MSAANFVFAPAKLNLALHVVGQRDDGYHLLETIAVFADVGDRIAVEAADADRFTLTGPEAGAIEREDPANNLVLRARLLLRRHAGERACPPVSITLEKNLPAGAGIGGGSADAAAALRALMAHWGLENGVQNEVREQAITLGADVPMCLASEPVLARGIGEHLTRLAGFPALPVLLVNPRQHVSTPAVFEVLTEKENPPLPETEMPAGLAGFCDWINERTRNDLQRPAMRRHPVIRDCIEALEATEPLLVRMSGSGATCFGVYADVRTAQRAAERLAASHPSWWIRSAETSPSTER